MRTGTLRISVLLLGLMLLAIACDVMDNSDDPLNSYTCPNGTPAADGRAGSDGDERCTACNDDYILNNGTCVVDTTKDADDDDSPDALDVDDDNDGLIEIRNLDMLYHMRYNLEGTTYDDEEADSGDGDAGSAAGAPTGENDNCDTATDGVYLCGYELTRNLDFAVAEHYARGADNAEWRPNAADPADADNAGWPGIGGITADDPAFAARFEGNGNTISNLYIRRSDNVGLFNTTAENAHIRAITVTDAALYGGNTGARIGILVGQNRGQITESSASGAITGGERNVNLGGIAGINSGEITDCSADAALISGDAGTNNVGGLVGQNEDGTISASSAGGQITIATTLNAINRGGGLVGINTGIIIGSYATGAVNIQEGNGLIGGLVGRNSNTIIQSIMQSGSIIASYATGAVDGGVGTDSAGGLVGENTVGSAIIASYATGAVDGGGGTDSAGGLVGTNSANGIIIASYAIGAVDGGGGTDSAGGLVGNNDATTIASYATGSARGGEGTNDIVGGLVGFNSSEGTVLASYATEDADGEMPGRLVGFNANTGDLNAITESYGFGMPTPDPDNQPVTDADTLQITDNSATTTYAGATWNRADDDTADAWDFGTTSQAPALRYADYDGANNGTDYCDMFPATTPGPDPTTDIECGTTLLPGQR